MPADRLMKNRDLNPLAWLGLLLLWLGTKLLSCS